MSFLIRKHFMTDKRFSIVQKLTVLALVTLISGCATGPQLTTQDPDAPPAANLWQWRAQGKMAFRDAQQSQSANLDWQQQGARYELLLTGPLGQGATRLSGRPFNVTLTLSDGQQIKAASPEQLIQRGLQWPLPISNLVYWIRGLPAPGAYQSLGEHQFSQDGWHVSFSRYVEQGNLKLPSRLKVERQQWRLILVINQWQTGSSATDLAP